MEEETWDMEEERGRIPTVEESYNYHQRLIQDRERKERVLREQRERDRYYSQHIHPRKNMMFLQNQSNRNHSSERTRNFETNTRFNRVDRINEKTETNVTCEGLNIPKPITEFSNISFEREILENLQQVGYQKPTILQKHVLPLASSLRDTLVFSSWKRGRCASFLLPIINHMLGSKISMDIETRRPKALILVHLNGLAKKVHLESLRFIDGTPLKSTFVTGSGGRREYEQEELLPGTDILISTSQRIEELIRSGYLWLNEIKYLVFYEFHRIDTTKDIRESLMRFSQLLPKREERKLTMIYCSTFFSSRIQESARKFLREDYVLVNVGVQRKRLSRMKLGIRRKGRFGEMSRNETKKMKRVKTIDEFGSESSDDGFFESDSENENERKKKSGNYDEKKNQEENDLVDELLRRIELLKTQKEKEIANFKSLLEVKNSEISVLQETVKKKKSRTKELESKISSLHHQLTESKKHQEEKVNRLKKKIKKQEDPFPNPFRGTKNLKELPNDEVELRQILEENTRNYHKILSTLRTKCDEKCDEVSTKYAISRCNIGKKELILSSFLCKICMERKTCMALGCGHLLCNECTRKIMEKDKNCPYCRTEISQATRIFRN